PSTNNQLVSIIYLSPVANLFLKFRITNLNKNNVNTQNTPVEESKVSQSATEQNARIDLTFVDDDDNGKIVDYSEYLPSEDNGHHYAYGKVGDKVSPKAYNK
ncbi:hypothetical protein AB0X97_04520, partial [Limosilactobacillus reuteri]